MFKKHCNPCDNFTVCMDCETEMCATCGESMDSPHMILTAEAHDELERMQEEDELWHDGLCNQCRFYQHHDINDPTQEEYDHDMIFKVEEYQDGTKMENFGVGGICLSMEVKNWKTRVVITGIKPEPTEPCIRGPFIFTETEAYKKSKETRNWRIKLKEQE